MLDIAALPQVSKCKTSDHAQPGRSRRSGRGEEGDQAAQLSSMGAGVLRCQAW